MSYNNNISSSDQQPPIITSENYEMYFLMYVDRELDKAGQAAVEAFLSAHPELQEEMNQLKEAVLTLPAAEEIVLPNKMNLYKFDGIINDQNVEEKIILSIDNELNKEEKTSLEAYLTQHTDAQQLHQQYRLTVLPQEKIEYPNKAALYQSTGKSVSMFRARWMELSIAAAVALFITVNIFSPMKPSEVMEDIRTTHSSVNQNQPVIPVQQDSKPAVTNDDSKPSTEIAVNNTSAEKPAKNQPAIESSSVKASQLPGVNEKATTEEKNSEKNISTESNISEPTNVEHTNNTSELPTTQTTATEESFYASFDVKTDSEALLADKQLEDLKSLMASNDLSPAHNEISDDPIPLRGLLMKVKREIFKSNRTNKNSSYSIHFK
jgi:anti-sigma factor RsiW